MAFCVDNTPPRLLLLTQPSISFEAVLATVVGGCVLHLLFLAASMAGVRALGIGGTGPNAKDIQARLGRARDAAICAMRRLHLTCAPARPRSAL